MSVSTSTDRLRRAWRAGNRWLGLAGRQCCAGRSQAGVRGSLRRRAGVDPSRSVSKEVGRDA